MLSRMFASLANFLVLLTGCVAFTLPVSAQHFSDWSAPVAIASLNTAAVDGCPFISKDGLSLYFASNRAGSLGGNDIYVSQRASRDDAWGAPASLGATINTSSADECPTLSNDGHLLFFVSNRANGCGAFDIYVSFRRHTKNDFGWESPENLGCVINTSFNEITPSHFVDEESGTVYLYFFSNRPTGPGEPLGANIFVSTQQADGTYGPGVLVDGLNTDFDDRRPNIRQNGLEIFFESNRPGSIGDFDLWSAARASISDPWSIPVNLSTVNTAAFEGRPSISSHGDTLYFMSNRAGTIDLYVSTSEKIAGSAD